MTDTAEANPVDNTEVHDEPQQESGASNDAPDDAARDQDSDDEADTFPREVVERLRHENGRFWQCAQRADDLLDRSRIWPPAGRSVTSGKGNAARPPNRSACLDCSKKEREPPARRRPTRPRGVETGRPP
jgi:hypothetical protein